MQSTRRFRSTPAPAAQAPGARPSAPADGADVFDPATGIATSATRIPLRRRIAYAAVVVGLVYGVAEVIATSLFRATVPSTYWLYEDHAPEIRFDPNSGYRVMGRPTRVAKFGRAADPRRAELEYVGAVGGNAQGFPDRGDFTASRTDPAAQRFVVFGDSFSGGDLEVRWPDRCEDAAREAGRTRELLNFSQSGFGLANWHRMLTTIVAPERYDVDGVVFAVWGNDLARRFYVCDRGDGSEQLGGRVQSWDPADYPSTRDEAVRWMSKWDGRAVSADEFAAALGGEWTPPRAWEPFFAKTLVGRVLARSGGSVAAVPPGRLAAELADTSQGRGRLVREIRDTLRAMGTPAIVVRIPMIEELVAGQGAPADDDARAFAEFLGAPFADGAEAFAGLGDAAIRELWHVRDLHWAQGGSDRFARWMDGRLAAWARERAAAQALPVRNDIPGETR